MKHLDDFISNLKKILGDNLITVLIFGSQAFVEPEKLKSNINLMIVLEHLSSDDLKQISKPVQKWVKAKNPIPIIMGKSEWYSSFDVYALEYLDIKEKYRLLYGEDLTKDINVDKHYLRLQCESELKNLFLKYRNNYLLNINSDREMEKLANNVIKTLLVIFRGVIRLHSELVPDSSEYVILQAAKFLDIDTDLLIKMANVRDGKTDYKHKEIRDISDRMVTILQDILRQVDLMRF